MSYEYECKIIPNRGHYEVYINRKFYCSADTFSEAVKEIEDYKKENCFAKAL